ncbi:MAG TPA: SpoIIE family protein phosphatase [Clostridia bacterium]|jgi:sigma-B regulation protein RsbU (phosphoserine phosphatase)|nr:SpoIIE family protein phosphatase [Clostridia bacterium]
MGFIKKQKVERKNKLSEYIKGYIIMLWTGVIALLVLYLVGVFEPYLYKIFPVDLYLTWHNLFELMSCVVSFSIFAVTFYTYSWTGNKRSLFLGCLFFLVGLLDMFHALSYNGMPVFFTSSSAPKATTFWIVARLCMAIGLTISWFIPRKDTERRVSPWIFFVPACTLAIAFLIIVNYCPQILPPMYIEGVGLTKTKIYLEYFVISLLSLSVLLFLQQYRVYKEKIYVLFVSALIISICGELAFTLYLSVYDTYNLVGHLYKLVSYYLFFKLLFIHNVYRPYEDLYKARQEISDYANNLEKLVAERTSQIAEVNEKILSDLDSAKRIQQAFLPADFLSFGEVEFSADYIFSERLGGDFYNIFPLTEKVIGMYIGDVAGHGVPAAMMTVFIYQTIEGRNFSKNIDREIYPNTVLQELYRIYNETDFPADMYIVMLLATFNVETGRLIYSSAGINTSPIVISRNKEKKFLEHEGFPICKLGNLYEPVYINYELNLEPGDKILFFTDGLTEVINSNGEIFGEERLYEILEEGVNQSAYDLKETILKEVVNFIGDKPPSDDITFFILSYGKNRKIEMEKVELA